MTAHHLETLQCGHTQSRQKLFLCTGQPLPSGIHWDIFAHLSPVAFHRQIQSKHKSKRDTEGKEHKLLLYSNSSAVCCSNCHSSTSFCCWVFGVVFFCVAAESISFNIHCFSPTFTVWYLSSCNFSFIFFGQAVKRFRSSLGQAALPPGTTETAASSEFQYPPFDIAAQIIYTLRTKGEIPLWN